MNIHFGTNHFMNVEIPILWGTRAVLMDKNRKISIINLADTKPEIEILGDKPAPNTKYEPIVGGYKILKDRVPLYIFDVSNKTISGISISLPDVRITLNGVHVGSNTFSNNMVSGFQVGISVTETAIAFGAPLPENLSKFVL